MSFKDIRLQDRAVEFLKRSIESGRLPHSLLFFGPAGVGKCLAALTLAKTLNCEIESPTDSCDICISCRKIERRIHPDVFWIGPEGPSNMIKTGSIKSMQETIVLKPFEGRVKFFIIERAHLLGEEAANRILKILEEPPKDSVIILITDNLNMVFPTLRSRCQWVLFSPARPEELKAILIDQYRLIDAHAHFISHLSEGRLGRAIEMKDSDILNWKNSVLDRFSRENIILNEDPFFFDNERRKILDMIDIILGWYRDIFVLKNGGSPGLLINIDRLDDARSKADALPEERIREIIYETLKARTYIQDNVNPKLALSNLACIVE